MRKLIILPFLVLVFAAFASIKTVSEYTTVQEDYKIISITDLENEMKNVANFYNQLSGFSVKIEHSSYKGHHAVVPYETIKGYFKRDGQKYVSNILAIHTIQTDKAKIIVDTTGKTILVASPDNLEPSEIMSLDYMLMKRNIKSVSVKNQKEGKRYKINFTSGTYLSFELYIGSTGDLKEIVFLFSNKYRSVQNDENSEMLNPKVVVTYKDLKKAPSISANDFDISKYISIPEKGEPIGKNQYKNFSIVDTRYKNDQLKNK